SRPPSRGRSPGGEALHGRANLVCRRGRETETRGEEPRPRPQSPKEPGCPSAAPFPPLVNLPHWAVFLGLPGLVDDAHPPRSHEEANDDEGDPDEDRPSYQSHDAGNHKHGSDDPQDGVSVAAALRREHPENFEHVASLHPWQL